MRNIVALSGGKDSTALALALSEFEPGSYEYICTPTGDELPEMILHWENLGKILGSLIKPITTGYTLGGLILKQGCLPNDRMRWCTRMLKIEPFEKYLLTSTPCTVFVGIRADEVDRDGVKWERINGVVRRYPLVEWGWGLKDVLNYLEKRGVTIPRRTDCASCFYQTVWEWYLLWKDHPKLFARAEAYEGITNHTFRYRNPMRWKDESGKWPAALEDLRKRFEAGEIPQKKREMKDRPAMCSVCAR